MSEGSIYICTHVYRAASADERNSGWHQQQPASTVDSIDPRCQKKQTPHPKKRESKTGKDEEEEKQEKNKSKYRHLERERERESECK